MKTNKKHFELFKKECQKWKKVLNLQDRELFFEHPELKEGVRAQCLYSFKGHNATLRLAKTFDLAADEKINEVIKYCARHEMCHVLVGDIAELAYSRFTSNDELMKSEEALVCNLAVIISKLKT